MDPIDGKMNRYTHEKFKTIWTGVLIIFCRENIFQTENQKHSTFSRFLGAYQSAQKHDDPGIGWGQ